MDFQHLRMLKKAVELILAKVDKPQISILGKLDISNISQDEIETNFEQEFKAYWCGVLKSKCAFGVFRNTEYGTLFVAGPLASLFLNDVYGKPLGTMSAGPYGILRGLGISENKVNYNLKLLKEGYYLLFVRTYSVQWKKLEQQLGKLE